MGELDLDKLEAAARAFVDAEQTYYQAAQVAINLEDSQNAARSVKEAGEAYNAIAEVYWQAAQPEWILALFTRVSELEAAVASKEAEGQQESPASEHRTGLTLEQKRTAAQKRHDPAPSVVLGASGEKEGK